MENPHSSKRDIWNI